MSQDDVIENAGVEARIKGVEGVERDLEVVCVVVAGRMGGEFRKVETFIEIVVLRMHDDGRVEVIDGRETEEAKDAGIGVGVGGVGEVERDDAVWAKDSNVMLFEVSRKPEQHSSDVTTRHVRQSFDELRAELGVAALSRDVASPEISRAHVQSLGLQADDFAKFRERRKATFFFVKGGKETILGPGSSHGLAVQEDHRLRSEEALGGDKALEQARRPGFEARSTVSSGRRGFYGVSGQCRLCVGEFGEPAPDAARVVEPARVGELAGQVVFLGRRRYDARVSYEVCPSGRRGRLVRTYQENPGPAEPNALVEAAAEDAHQAAAPARRRLRDAHFDEVVGIPCWQAFAPPLEVGAAHYDAALVAGEPWDQLRARQTSGLAADKKPAKQKHMRGGTAQSRVM